MLKKIAAFIITTFVITGTAHARDQIKAAGSSTIYPFITVVAEEFGLRTDFKTPIVESIGTGGGFMLFCIGDDESTPDLANASRQIKKIEKERCEKNGVKEITEIKIGYDGIVLANSKESQKIDIKKQDLFKALAKRVVVDGVIVDNPYEKWSDIDPELPEKKIEIYGPPPTSGTRDILTQLVMVDSCMYLPEFILKHPDSRARKNACSLLRNDGGYIESGENDNLIVQKLKVNKDAFGIFGFSFLDQNRNEIQGSQIDAEDPTFDEILSRRYPLSRPLYVYLKDSHIGLTDGLKEFVSELVSDKAIGGEGYLVEKGLIPLGDSELENVQKLISSK